MFAVFISLKIATYMFIYGMLYTRVKQTLEAVKLRHLLLLFTQMYRFWLIKRNFSTITWRISCYDFKNILICWEIWKRIIFNFSIAHIKPRIYGFSWTISLFSSSRSTETRRRGAPVQIQCNINHGSTKQFKSAYKEVEMARLHQQIRFYISFAFVNTIG